MNVTPEQYQKHVREIVYFEMLLGLGPEPVTQERQEELFAAAVACGRSVQSCAIDILAAIHGDDTQVQVDAAMDALNAEVV